MAVTVTLKRWGNSMGVLLPKSFIESKGLKENDEIFIEVGKRLDFGKAFGSAPRRTRSGQSFKDMVRKGWS